jgi:hypothetical protein
LFISWVKAEFVGTTFHISHFIIKNVKYQFNNTAFPPCPKCMEETLGGFDEQH